MPYNFGSAAEAAKTIATSRSLKLNSGTLIAVPVPKEYAMDGSSNKIGNFLDVIDLD